MGAVRGWERKALSAVMALACFCLMGALPVSSDPLLGFDPLDLVARMYGTPDRIALFLRKNMTFGDDMKIFGEEDYWQSPEEFFYLKCGDCEDYALLSQALLTRQGIQAFVFSLYGEGGYAHAVCVFVEEGRYSIINQDRAVHYKARSLEELAGRIYPRWMWGAVARKIGHRGHAVRLVRREGAGH